MSGVEDAPSFAAQLGGTALALLLVLVLAWVALRGLKRLQQRAAGSGPGEAIVLLRSTPLGPRERVVALRYRGREYLLGVTAAQVTVIDRHDAPTITTPTTTADMQHDGDPA